MFTCNITDEEGLTFLSCL